MMDLFGMPGPGADQWRGDTNDDEATGDLTAYPCQRCHGQGDLLFIWSCHVKRINPGLHWPGSAGDAGSLLSSARSTVRIMHYGRNGSFLFIVDIRIIIGLY